MAAYSPRTNYLHGAAWLFSVLVIAVALTMAWHLLYTEGLPSTIRQQIQRVGVTAKVATWNDLGDLKSKMQKIVDVRNQISELKKKASPGPEPDWLWHPIDHYLWSNHKEEYDAASAKLASLLNLEHELVQSTGDLANAPGKVLQVINSVGPLRVFWNEWVHPYLEVLLIFALLRFGFGLILRLLLISGLIPQTKL